MNVQKEVSEYIASQPEPKRSEMQQLHGIVLAVMPACKLWFLDGKDEKGKIVSNPSIGYGLQTMKYADGKTKEFYQIGISANTTGISVYILGISDKKPEPEIWENSRQSQRHGLLRQIQNIERYKCGRT
jgi:hypothetical protein